MPQTFPDRSDTSSVADISWRKFFADEHLVALIDTALRSNFDALIALQRIEAAQAYWAVSRGALLPVVDAVASAGVDKFGDYTMNGVGNFDTNLSENVRGDRRIPNPTPDYFLGLRSSWEIDLWGKLRSQRRAASARLLASRKGQQLVTTSLVALVAGHYYRLLALDGEMEIIRKNARLQEIALETVKIQKLGGRATQLAVQQFEAQLLRTRSLEAEKRQEIIETENQLNGLLGRFPQPIERGVPIREQFLPESVEVGIPARMLRRRPDVQQAEALLSAAKADVEAARAAFLPSLRITPYLGFNAFKSALLFNPGSVAYGVLGGLSAPLVNRTRIKGQYNQTMAVNREQYYRYQQAVVRGYQEVVTNLKRIENLQQAYQLKKQQADVLTEAVATANDLFVTGYASYLEVITAQRSVLDAELALITTRREQFLSLIELYRALGGGWE